MPKNIKEIVLNETSYRNDGLRTVVVRFNQPCTWTTFGINDLREILRLWIVGEEMKYPQSKGFQGRWMLFREIKKVFDETEVK